MKKISFEEIIQKWMKTADRFVFMKLDNDKLGYVIPLDSIKNIEIENKSNDEILKINNHFVAYNIKSYGLYRDNNLGGISIICNCDHNQIYSSN